MNEFETSLPIRLDYEACLAYLLLPPAGGVLLLVLEQKSDYVRYVYFLLILRLSVGDWGDGSCCVFHVRDGGLMKWWL